MSRIVLIYFCGNLLKLLWDFLLQPKPITDKTTRNQMPTETHSQIEKKRSWNQNNWEKTFSTYNCRKGQINCWSWHSLNIFLFDLSQEHFSSFPVIRRKRILCHATCITPTSPFCSTISRTGSAREGKSSSLSLEHESWVGTQCMADSTAMCDCKETIKRVHEK